MGRIVATAHEQLDASGLRCPLPVLKARKRLAALPPGAVLELCADDPAAPLDVEHFCIEQGHILLGQEPAAGGGWVFSIRKGGERAAQSASRSRT